MIDYREYDFHNTSPGAKDDSSERKKKTSPIGIKFKSRLPLIVCRASWIFSRQ